MEISEDTNVTCHHLNRELLQKSRKSLLTVKSKPRYAFNFKEFIREPSKNRTNNFLQVKNHIA